MLTKINYKSKFNNMYRNYNLNLIKTHDLLKEFYPFKNITEGNKKKIEPIFNNYNLKLNVTKNKTKNISIGNLTMNNKSKNELLNFLNTPLSRSISPFNSLNVKKYVDKKFEKSRSKDKSSKVSSGIDSPRSYDKIIRSLKSEFAKIKNKNSKDRKTINSNNNKYINKSFILNKSQNNDFKIFVKRNKSGNKINKDHHIKLNNNNIQKKLSDNRLGNTTTCFINNITFDMKKDNNFIINNKFIQSKQISFSLINNDNTPKKNILKIQLIQQNNIINFLLSLIKIQKNVFVDNINIFTSKYFKFQDSKKNQELKEQIDILIKENKNLKKVSLSLIYLLKSDYLLNINYEKKLKEKVSQILKENNYLRLITQSLNYLKDVNYQNLKYKNQKGEEEDDISDMFNQSLSEKTLKNKKKLLKNDYSVNIKDYSTLINNTKNNYNKLEKNTIIKKKLGNNIYKMKRIIKYQKKSNSNN